jgi:capsular polysaccharide biosynthesis protein
VDFKDAVRDRRRAYFLGVNARHFGHFLLETLCRAWAWKGQEDDRVAIIMSPPVHDFARALCALVPGLAERVEVIRETTRFESVAVPSPAFAISRSAHVAFKSLCEQMADRALPRLERMTDQPVYLSRAGLDPRKTRMLVGEDRLERSLEKLGFRIVRPETLAIPEQIAIFNRHKWIVAPMGSACHSRLFSRRPNNILMLERTTKANYVLCDLLCEGAAHYAQVLSVPGLDRVTAPGATEPVMLDEEKLLALLRELGLVHAKAEFDGPATDIETYKQKWIEFAKQRAERKDSRRLKRAVDEVTASFDDHA